MNVLASKIVFILKCHSDLQIKCGDQSDSPIANLSLSGPFPERISNIKQISTLCNEQIGFFFLFRRMCLSNLAIRLAGLYTELFYAIIPTLFLCFLLICYPYILLYF